MNAICVTCGTQFANAAKPPPECPICNEERQYVGLDGQQWTTLEELRQGHETKVADEEALLTSFSIEPHFGIGQRAFLIQTPKGNVLWDCISLLDGSTIRHIKALGGLQGIAISHPHYYTTMVEWSRAFGNVPIYLHKEDEKWVMRPDSSIRFWEGDTCRVLDDLTLIHCGGHFAGSTVLYFPSGAGGKGVLLSGDTIQVVPDRRWVSFMYSYPNCIPLPADSVQRIVRSVEPFTFDRIYAAFPKMTVATGGRDAVRRSAERYMRAIGST
ncbi:MAG: MBL fold metallo-hydrolase [Bryobacteraceae bacterium]